MHVRARCRERAIGEARSSACIRLERGDTGFLFGDDGEVVSAVFTVHPAAVLRGPTAERRRQLRDMLVGDLAVARRAAEDR